MYRISPGSWRSPDIPSLIVPVALLVVGCQVDTPVLDEPPGYSPPVVHRSSDDVLVDPEVQALVDRQIARDGRGVAQGFALGANPRRRAAFALGSIQDSDTRLDAEVRLDDPDPLLRADLAFALGRIGDVAAGPALLAQLRRETESSVRRELLEALGHAGGIAELEALLEMDLVDAEVPLRALAVARGGLRDVSSTETTSWLAGALASPNPDVRHWAALFFERAPNPEAFRTAHSAIRTALEEASQTDPATRRLLPALARLEEVEDTDLLASWVRKSTDWRTRAVAVSSLRERAGAEVAQATLLKALDDPILHVAEAAASELGRSRPALLAVQDDVLDWIDSKDVAWQVLEHLMIGLGPLGHGERVATWYESLPREAIAERVAALGALGRVPGREHLDLLFAAAADPEDRVAAVGIRSLSGHWGGDREDAALRDRYAAVFQEALSRSHPTIVGVAANSLTDPLLLAAGSGQWLEQALLTRDPLDPSAAPGTRALVAAFADTRDPEWIPLLQRYQDHPQPSVAEAAHEAVQALSGEPGHGRPRPRSDGDHLRINWEGLGSLGPRPRVEMLTEEGRVVLELLAEEAPLTVQTFLRFVEEGSYDGTPFHRVVPNFVVQGGDVGRRDGTGGPGFAIRTELTTLPFERGVLGMASAGKDTEGSQFFIMHSRAPHLEGRYTSFGWVVEGMEVVDRLNRGETILQMNRIPE